MEELLQRAHSIISEYREAASQSGERFNVFQLLGLATSEVRTHSAFIGSLLDSNGMHGCGDRFLKLFLDHIATAYPLSAGKLSEFKTQKSTAKIEYYIGKRLDEEGGRIDVLLTDENDRHIIIENKIYAGDQRKQLFRYHQFDRQAPLFYLTLYGQDPSSESCENLIKNEHFSCLSYKNDIVAWLERCLFESLHFPGLSETIRQYQHLIKTLTHQTSTSVMDTKIVNLLASDDNYIESSFHIAENLEDLKIKRGEEIAATLREKLKSHPHLLPIEGYFQFPRIEVQPKNWEKHLIGFTFEGGLFFGIKRKNAAIQTVQKNEACQVMGNEWNTSAWWLCSRRENNGVANLYSMEPWLKRNEEELVNFMYKWIIEIYDRSATLNL